MTEPSEKSPLDSAELSVLGAILATGGDALDDVTLQPEDFTVATRRRVFAQMQTMRGRGEPTDLASMLDALPEHAVELGGMLDWAVVPASVAHHAGIIRKHALHRRLVAVGHQLANLPVDESESDMSEEASRLLEGALSKRITPSKAVGAILPAVLARPLHQGANLIPTPWRPLTAALGGFRAGAMYVIAARPGNGKTILATQIAVELAQHGYAAFSSLEMTGEELTARFISQRLLIPHRRIANRDMHEDDWKKIHERQGEVANLRIEIDDRSGVGPADVRAFARSVQRKAELAGTRLTGIVIDYLQLMTSNERIDRHLQVASFSRQMKIMAKDFGVPVIVLSQLNRNSENRDDGRPRNSDIRESGAIEQDADVIMLLRREGQDWDEKLIVDVSKNRHGPVGEIDLDWQATMSRVVDPNEELQGATN